MKKLKLVRSYLSRKTIGVMFDHEFKCHTLELKWNDNKPNESCIPEGTYSVVRDNSGKYQFYSVKGVANRSAIEIHIANTIADLAGCIGLGMTSSNTGNLISSKMACDRFVDYMGDDSFTLTITKFDPLTMNADIL